MAIPKVHILFFYHLHSVLSPLLASRKIMASGAAYIIFKLPNKGNFVYTDGYEEATDTEIDILLRQGREALRSLEAEHEKRRLQTVPGASRAVQDCQAKLLTDAGRFEILGRLDSRASGLTVKAVSVLKTEQNTRDGKIYQSFLHDVLRHSGTGTTLLCAASLGRSKVANLTTVDRTALLGHVKAEPSLRSGTFDALARQYEIPSQNGARKSVLTTRHKFRLKQKDPQLARNLIVSRTSVRTEGRWEF
jgi:hypothetical protein